MVRVPARQAGSRGFKSRRDRVIITSRRTRVFSAVSTLAFAITLLAGCDKAAEPFKDAPRSGTNSAPAKVIEMPDGFSNLATKCDDGNRIYVVFHGDNTYGSVSVVPHDPSC